MNIKGEHTNQANGALSSIFSAVPQDIAVFAAAAQHYCEKKCSESAGRNPQKQAMRLKMILEKYCGPWLGAIFMSELKTSDVVRTLEPIWEAKPAVAERTRLTIFNVY